MLKVIKSEKLDVLFNKILIYTFSIYIFCSHIIESQIYFLPLMQDICFYLPLLALAYLIFKIIYNLLRGKFSIIEIVVAIFVSAVLIAIQHFSGSAQIAYFIILFYILAFKDTDIKKWIKNVFLSMFIAFVLIVGFSLIGITSNHQVVQNAGARVRFLLGYDWNNVAHNHFFAIVLMYMLFKERLKVYDYVVIVLVNIILYIFTTSKCAFVCVFLALIIYVILHLIKNEKASNMIYKVFGYIALTTTVLAPLIMGYLSYSYSKFSPFMVKLDSLFSGRLALAHNGFRKWGITLFGQAANMSQESNNYSFVDCSYLGMLFSNGIVILILLLAVYAVFIWKSIKLKNKTLTLMLFMILLHSSIEPWWTSLTNFPIIVLFLAYLGGQDGLQRKI